MTAAAGGLALAVPMTNGLATGDWFWSVGEADHMISALVDMGFVALGVAAVLVSTALPRKRSEKPAQGVRENLASQHTV